MPAWMTTYLPTISAGLMRLAPLQHVLGVVTGGLSNLAGVLWRGAGWLWNGLTGIYHIVQRAGTYLLGTIVALTYGLIQSFRMMMQSVEQFARSVTQIRNATGLSMGASQATAWQFMALGMKPQETAQMLAAPAMMPFQFNMRASLFGLPGYDRPSFAPQLAQWYQGMAGRGQMGRFMANTLLSNVLFNGQMPPQMLAIANMPQNKLREQMSFTGQAMNVAGVNPEMLRRYAEDLPLVQARLGLVLQMLVVRLMTEAAPALEHLAMIAANFAGKNMGKAVGFIQEAVEWLWVYAPIYIMQGAQTGVTAIIFLVGGFFMMVRGIANLLRALEMGQGGLAAFIGGFLQAIDYISVGWHSFIFLLMHGAAILANTGIAIMNIGIAIVKMIGWVFEALPRLLESAFPKLKGVWSTIFGDPANRFTGKMADMSFIPMVDYNTTQSVVDTIAPVTDFYGQWQNLQNSGTMGKMADQLNAFADRNEPGVMGALNNIHDAINKQLQKLGTADERRKSWQELLKATKDVEKAVRETGQQRAANISAHDVMERILSYIAEDSYLTASRVNG